MTDRLLEMLLSRIVAGCHQLESNQVDMQLHDLAQDALACLCGLDQPFGHGQCGLIGLLGLNKLISRFAKMAQGVLTSLGEPVFRG